jgi:predicted secreted hydrolase
MKRSALALLAAAVALRCSPPRGETNARLEIAPEEKSTGFARVTEVRPFRLPDDHGPHYGFQTEWWYFTGNLRAEDGRTFGYQLTFFRRGLAPGTPPSPPGLATNQIQFGHLAITDVAAGTHDFVERWGRGWGPLAGARADPFGVWLEDWRVDAVEGAPARWRLRAALRGRPLELEPVPTKPLTAHGDRGLSAKSREPGNASYYIGYTRLETRGAIAGLAVQGLSWFDHEWSTSALGPGAVGWDWFSLQLDDPPGAVEGAGGREIMLFQIRREDGSLEPVSGGTFVEANGRTRRLLADEAQVDVLDHWTSPATHARYPSRWTLRIPTLGLVLDVRPRLADQEMRTSFRYWEGAVTVSGTAGGRPVSGSGYVELTGYAGPMQQVF